MSPLAGVRARRLALALFGLALAVRLLFIGVLGREQRIYDSLHDQYIYIDLAKSIVAGRGLSLTFDIFVADADTPTAIVPPVYPLLLSGVFWLFGESYLALRLLQAVLGAAVCFITYFIGRRAFGEPVGLWSVVMASVYPPLVMYTRPIMTETLYSLMLSLIMLLLIRFCLGTCRPVHFAVGGALLGVTCLLRSETFVFVPLVVAFVFWLTLRDQPNDLRHFAGSMTLAALAFALTVSPWAVRNWYVEGEPLVVANKAWNVWAQNRLRYMRQTASLPAECVKGMRYCGEMPDFDTSTELQRDRHFRRLGTQFIASHPLLAGRYAVSRVLLSYPVFPREELPPPFGYRGVRKPPPADYHPTQLNDVPQYLDAYERVRVWSFRFVLAFAAFGFVTAVKRQRAVAIALSLPVIANLTTAFLLVGTERLRIPVDPYLIIFAACGVLYAGRRPGLVQTGDPPDQSSVADSRRIALSIRPD